MSKWEMSFKIFNLVDLSTGDGSGIIFKSDGASVMRNIYTIA